MWNFIVNGLVILALVEGCRLLYQWFKVSGQDFKSAWWKWTLSVAWCLGVLIAAGFVGATIGEGSYLATVRGGGTFLAILLITGGLIFRFCFLTGGKEKKETKSAIAGKEV